MFARYRAIGVRTLPVQKDKKPIIKEWQKVTVETRWEDSYPLASIGAICGELFTIVDVDDPAYVEEARERFGPTPVEVKTRKGTHLYYKSSGERRQIRALGEHVPIDILGKGGYAVVPNSEGYEFLRGDIEDLVALPPMACDALPVQAHQRVSQATGQGGRNDALFAFGLGFVENAQSYEEVFARLVRRNQDFAPPMESGEVASVAKSVWKVKQEGRLMLPGHPGVFIQRDDLDLLRAHPDALALFADLKDLHGWRHGKPFYLANKARDRYAMTIDRFGNSWRRLEGLGLIEIVNRGGVKKGDARQARLT